MKMKSITARQLKNWAYRQSHLLVRATDAEYLKACLAAPVRGLPTTILLEAWRGLKRFPRAANVMATVIVEREASAA